MRSPYPCSFLHCEAHPSRAASSRQPSVRARFMVTLLLTGALLDAKGRWHPLSSGMLTAKARFVLTDRA